MARSGHEGQLCKEVHQGQSHASWMQRTVGQMHQEPNTRTSKRRATGRSVPASTRVDSPSSDSRDDRFSMPRASSLSLNKADKDFGLEDQTKPAGYDAPTNKAKLMQAQTQQTAIVELTTSGSSNSSDESPVIIDSDVEDDAIEVEYDHDEPDNDDAEDDEQDDEIENEIEDEVEDEDKDDDESGASDLEYVDDGDSEDEEVTSDEEEAKEDFAKQKDHDPTMTKKCPTSTQARQSASNEVIDVEEESGSQTDDTADGGSSAQPSSQPKYHKIPTWSQAASKAFRKPAEYLDDNAKLVASSNRRKPITNLRNDGKSRKPTSPKPSNDEIEWWFSMGLYFSVDEPRQDLFERQVRIEFQLQWDSKQGPQYRKKALRGKYGRATGQTYYEQYKTACKDQMLALREEVRTLSLARGETNDVRRMTGPALLDCVQRLRGHANDVENGHSPAEKPILDADGANNESAVERAIGGLGADDESNSRPNFMMAPVAQQLLPHLSSNDQATFASADSHNWAPFVQSDVHQQISNVQTDDHQALQQLGSYMPNGAQGPQAYGGQSEEEVQQWIEFGKPDFDAPGLTTEQRDALARVFPIEWEASLRAKLAAIDSGVPMSQSSSPAGRSVTSSSVPSDSQIGVGNLQWHSSTSSSYTTQSTDSNHSPNAVLQQQSSVGFGTRLGDQSSEVEQNVQQSDASMSTGIQDITEGTPHDRGYDDRVEDDSDMDSLFGEGS